METTGNAKPKAVTSRATGNELCASSAQSAQSSSLFNTLNKRSYTMKNNSFIHRGMSALVALFLIVGLAMSQDFVINTGGAITNTGTIRIKGNITNSGVAGASTFAGIVELKGTAAQSIGNGTQAINFATLTATAISAKTFNVASTVSTAINLTSASTTQFIVAAGKKLTIGGTIANGGGATTPYDFTPAAAEVDYANGTSNTIFSTSYDKLTLSGAGTFSVATGGVTAAGAVSHTGGNLTVDNNLTASAGYTFATITNIAASRVLTLGTTGSIAAITNINATGQLVNGNSTLTVTTLTNNSGTITALASGGAITFTNGATNSLNIIGGAGAITFSSTLAHATGTITSGSGGVVFNGVPTISSGTVTSAAGTLDFNAAVVGLGGTISLTSIGVANFANTFTSDPTFSFASGTTVNFDGATQSIPAGVTYGHLNMVTAGTKLALGSITVANNFVNNSGITTDMSTFTLAVTGTRTNTGGTMQFGGVTNGVLFTTGTVEYNRLGAQDLTGNATLKYATLTLSGTGTKTVKTGAANTVTTTGSVSAGTGLTLDVVSGGVLFVEGNLNITGTLTNAGTIDVGTP